MSEQRPQDALNHLQAAATELIAAARLVLDMADDLVSRSIRLMAEMGDGEQPAPPSSPVEKIPVVGRNDEAASPSESDD